MRRTRSARPGICPATTSARPTGSSWRWRPRVFGTAPSYKVLGRWTLTAAGLVLRQVRELREPLPRYAQDNLFDSSKFKRRFGDFEVTPYRAGLERIRDEAGHGAA